MPKLKDKKAYIKRLEKKREKIENKQTPIRMREKDEERMIELTKKFNAKIRRESKRHPQMYTVLPEQEKAWTILNRVKTRQEYNYEVKRMEEFLKRDATDIVKTKEGGQTTKWAKEQLRRDVNQVNRQRKLRRESMSMQARKETEDKATGRNKYEEERAFRPIQVNPKDRVFTPEGSVRRMENIRKQAIGGYIENMDEVYKLNLMKTIESAFGKSNRVREINDRIRKIDSWLIADLRITDDFFDIGYMYSIEQSEERLDSLHRNLMSYGF